MPLNAQNVKLLTSEIHIMKESTHENIVRYYESFRVEDKLWVAMVLIIMLNHSQRERKKKGEKGEERRECVRKMFGLAVSLGTMTVSSRREKREEEKKRRRENVTKSLTSVFIMIQEYMGGGCLTEILEQYEYIQLGEPHIAWVCQQVKSVSNHSCSPFTSNRFPSLEYIKIDFEGIGLHS